MQLLHAQYRVKFIVVCQSINHILCSQSAPSYNHCIALLNRCLGIVLEALPFATVWCHKGLRKPNVPILCGDGIHLNHKGQYTLYSTYRNAILCTLRNISLSLSPKADQLILPPAYFRWGYSPLLWFKHRQKYIWNFCFQILQHNSMFLVTALHLWACQTCCRLFQWLKELHL